MKAGMGDSMLRSALVCSKDPHLLLTRSLVLERAGFKVTRVSSVAAMAGLTEADRIDLAVLGQTLDASEMKESVRIICEQWPKSRILILNITGEPIVDVPNCEHLRSSDGPEALLAKARELTA
jgi:DNA-binding response OmpR family regulator